MDHDGRSAARCVDVEGRCGGAADHVRHFSLAEVRRHEYVRSSADGGAKGGVAQRTREATVAMDKGSHKGQRPCAGSLSEFTVNSWDASASLEGEPFVRFTSQLHVTSEPRVRNTHGASFPLLRAASCRAPPAERPAHEPQMFGDDDDAEFGGSATLREAELLKQHSTVRHRSTRIHASTPRG